MNASSTTIDVDGKAVKLCTSHAKRHNAGKSVEWTDRTYTEENGNVHWHSFESR